MDISKTNITSTEFHCFSQLPKDIKPEIMGYMIKAKAREYWFSDRKSAIKTLRGINREFRQLINYSINQQLVARLPKSTLKGDPRTYEYSNQKIVDTSVSVIEQFKNSGKSLPICVEVPGYSAENNEFLKALGNKGATVNSLTINDEPINGARTCPKRNINKEGLSTLSKVKGLERLEITYCLFISNETLKPLASKPELKYLKVSECDARLEGDVLNEGFLSDISKCTKLEELNLGKQTGLSPKVFDYLAAAPSLKKLNVDFVAPKAKADDWKKFIQQISARGGLESLSMWCANISDEILTLIAQWPSLKSLDISCAKGVTTAGIDAFKAKRPDVILTHIQ